MGFIFAVFIWIAVGYAVVEYLRYRGVWWAEKALFSMALLWPVVVYFTLRDKENASDSP